MFANECGEQVTPIRTAKKLTSGRAGTEGLHLTTFGASSRAGYSSRQLTCAEGPPGIATASPSRRYVKGFVIAQQDLGALTNAITTAT